jgi:hypothetical protein
MILNTKLSGLSGPTHPVQDPLTTDPLSKLETLEQILSWCNPTTTLAFSCVSRFLSEDVPACLSPETAFKICSSVIDVFDTREAKTPTLRPFELIKGHPFELVRKCHALPPRIGFGRGLSFLIMRGGLTINELIAIAKKKGFTMYMELEDKIVEELGDVYTEQDDELLLISNHVYEESRGMPPTLAQWMIHKAGGEVPTIQEYMTHCIFGRSAAKECPYSASGNFFANSFTQCDKYILGIQASNSPPGIRIAISDPRWSPNCCGAGGRWKC